MLRLTIVDGTHQAALTLFDAAKKSWDVLYLNLLKQKKKKKKNKCNILKFYQITNFDHD